MSKSPRANQGTQASSAPLPKVTQSTDATPPPFPIIGVGASAGGLAAFEAFFSGMPADVDPGMAFVLVQHLAPDHKSILSDLIRRYTRMQVFEVEDGMQVLPNCAYIIPPNYDMALSNGSLHLLEPVAPRGQRLPIDYFFESLADDQHENAIGIVLSGTGSDGTLGVRAIKDAGGMVMAQNTASSEFDGMPRSAIATGLVDYQLPPSEMPVQLMAYVAHTFGKLSRSGLPAIPKNEGALKKIFVLLRTQTGHDFSQYKPSTIYRRVERRMVVSQIDTQDAYVRYLQQTPSEREALFRDLLIGVTSFFRDPEAFKVVEDQVIPKLFAGKSAGSTVRVWSTGCSTGEEAYSLAILLVEHMEALKQNYIVQVFATDIDSRAIAVARLGVYPANIASDLSPERLARFFSLEPGGQAYRVHKGIRDLLVFSEQDLIRDPSFSRLDLISCRNLLIYLDANLQKRLIPLFHYALNPGGMLFLGSSEGVGEFDSLFAVLERKAKIYQRKDDGLGQPRSTLNRFMAPVSALDVALSSREGNKVFSAKLPLRELMEQALLRQIAPASALVNAGGDIVYLHGRTGMYLEPTAGDAGVQNILKMAREGLRPALSTMLHQTVSNRSSSMAPNIRVKTNGHHTLVNVSVHPVATASPGAADAPDAPLYLVMLDDAPESTNVATADANSGSLTPDAQAKIEALTQELRAKDEYLQSTHEELETSNEELKSSNEEMQSVNEELQSTNEELETSKEELQSLNEELATVNTELQVKVTDLSRANNDMNNLLAGTGVGTVFVDFQMRILRFTPAAKSIINLIGSDVGRPVSHFASNLVDYTNLVIDIKAVLDTLVPVEREVQTPDGKRYNLRIQPYRTLDNMIEGAVISFVDITQTVNTRAALASSRAELERTRGLLERTSRLAQVGGWEMDLRTQKHFWTLETYRIHDVDSSVEPELAAGISFYAPQAQPSITAAMQAGMDHGTSFDLEAPFITASGRHIWVRTQGFAVMEDGKAIRLQGAIQDITERKTAQDALRKANDLLRLAVVVRDTHDAITMQDLTGKTMAWNPGAVRLYGWSEQEALAMNVRQRIPEALRKDALATLSSLSRAEVLQPYQTQRLTSTGAVLEVSIISSALLDEGGQMYAIATTERSAQAE